MWAAAVTTVAPVAEPVTLVAAKEFCRIDADDDTFDTELTALIAGVRDDVESFTGTRLIDQTVELRADSFADIIRFPIGPVSAVSELHFTDAAGDEQTLSAETDFELFGAGLASGLRPKFGRTWPAGAIRAGAVRCVVQVGYGASGPDLPPSLYAVLLRAIRAEFDGKALPLEQLLDNHRIWL